MKLQTSNTGRFNRNAGHGACNTFIDSMMFGILIRSKEIFMNRKDDVAINFFANRILSKEAMIANNHKLAIVGNHFNEVTTLVSLFSSLDKRRVQNRDKNRDNGYYNQPKKWQAKRLIKPAKDEAQRSRNSRDNRTNENFTEVLFYPFHKTNINN